MPYAIFCFRRDLRLHDNLGLIALLKHAAKEKEKEGGVTPIHLFPVFCLDPRQIDFTKNSYRSLNAIRFMFESLVDLDTHIRAETARGSRCRGGGAVAEPAVVAGLTVLYGKPESVLPDMVRTILASGTTAAAADTTTAPTCYIGWNEDVTPFACARDKALTSKLLALNRQKRSHPVTVEVVTHPDDLTVVPVRNIWTTSSTPNPYKVFTPFLRQARAKGVPAPIRLPTAITKRCCWQTLVTALGTAHALSRHIVPVDALFTDSRLRHLHVQDAAAKPTTSSTVTIATVVRGGRREGLLRLRPTYLQRRCKAYATARDHAGEECTTRLSAYLKFGCVSFREAHAAITTALHAFPKASEALTRELFWSAFYVYITYHFPHVLEGQIGKRNMEMHTRIHGKADALWAPAVSQSATTREAFHRWTTGTTGFPFVDAAMRQLKQTGWMHNRARMVVASFLTKDLLIDWREGERHFATHLVDYDPSANNGGWQWAASTGADAQPYFRIFNPLIQGKTHDPQAVYIKRFVPELASVNPKDIHRWDVPHIRHKYAKWEGVSQYPEPMVDRTGVIGRVKSRWKSL